MISLKAICFAILLATVAVLILTLTSLSSWAGTGPLERLDGVVDLAGHSVNPFGEADKIAANVLLFVAVDCPISNKYVPEFKRLVNEFESKGVRFWFVYPDPDTTREAIRKHVKGFDLKGRVVCDTKHELVRKSHAEVTPEAALFSAAGELLYHGRIDDRFLTLGTQRTQPTDKTLQVALTSLLVGKKPLVSETKAVGCRIPTPQ